MKKIIILYSGGADSTLLVKLAQAQKLQIRLLTFDYGQTHIGEINIALQNAKALQLPIDVVKVQGFSVHSQLVDGQQAEGNVSEWHVPGRNLIFASIAASFAESEKIDEIWYGANYEDRINLFPDCYQEWVFRVNHLLEINGARPVKIVAPLMGMPKEHVERLLGVYNMDELKIFSGYGTERE